MNVPTPATSNRFSFSLNRDVLDNNANVAVTLDAANDLDLLDRLVDNKPLPDRDIILGSGQLALTAATETRFRTAKGNVTFDATAHSRLALLAGPARVTEQILRDVDLADQIEPALQFNSATDSYLVLRWGYSLNANGAGSIALAPSAGLNFSVNAGRAGVFGVVRELPKSTPARDAIAQLIGSWRMPSQISEISDVAPGTTLLAEVDGRIGFKASATFGYDLNWIRETSLGELKGDIGLRLQAGMAVTLGFDTSGKYVIVVSRESDAEQIRVRLFRLKMRGWSAGFNSRVTVSPETGLLPGNIDELIAGALGTDGRKILKQLQRVDQWTDPARPLFGPLVGLATEEARKLLQEITGVSADELFTEGKRRLQRLFEAWNQLPEQTAALLWSYLNQPAALRRIVDVTSRLANQDTAGLRQTLFDVLGRTGFAASPEGKVLESIATHGLLSALDNRAGQAEILRRSLQIADLLNQSLLEGILKRLQSVVNQRLNLGQIEAAINSADLTSLDPWLAARLEDFLEERLDLTKLRELRDQIHRLSGLRQEMYAKAVKALRQKYEFQLTAAYETTTTTTALIDAVFDFGIQSDAAKEALGLTLNGRFDELLTLTDNPAVRLNEGSLTHGVRRQTGITLSLPFFERKRTHVNEALAGLKKVSSGPGEVLLYDLKAKDEVEVRHESKSCLTIGMTLGAVSHDALDVHSTESAAYVYALDRAVQDLTRADLEHHYGPVLLKLMPGKFAAETSSSGTYAQWLDEVFGDRRGRIGNGLISLDTALPPKFVLAWLNAPEREDAAAYHNMSLWVQARFKELLSYFFFADVRRFKNIQGATPAVLAFSSIVPNTGARLAADGRVEFAPMQFSSGDSLYFNWPDDGAVVNLRAAVLRAPETINRLVPKLRAARARLRESGDLKIADFYEDRDASSVIGMAEASGLLPFLFSVEALLVEQVRAAGIAIAKAKSRIAMGAAREQAEARKQLARFGQKVTEAFHEKLRNFAVDDALLPLGSLMFAEAARAFEPDLVGIPTNALFSISILKDGVAFPPDGFPNHEPPAPETIQAGTEQRLVFAV